jgi:hypothetical protein
MTASLESCLLLVETGPEKGLLFQIPPSGARIGRAPDNDIVLSDPSLSRYHCRLEFKSNGSLWIDDLGSTNATLVNGNPVANRPLHAGDTLEFGEIRLVLQSNRPAAPAVSPPPRSQPPAKPPRSNGEPSPVFAAVILLAIIAGAVYWLAPRRSGKPAEAPRVVFEHVVTPAPVKPLPRAQTRKAPARPSVPIPLVTASAPEAAPTEEPRAEADPSVQEAPVEPVPETDSDTTLESPSLPPAADSLLLSNAPPIDVFRTGDEIIVKVDRFDLLRQENPGLTAELKLQGAGKFKTLKIDLADSAVKGSLVIDMAEFGKCDGIAVTVKSADGRTLAEKTAKPILEIPAPSSFDASSSGFYAVIEPGMAMIKEHASSKSALPRIQLPSEKKLRSIKLAAAKRSSSMRDITFPVETEQDAPLVTGAVVGRQTADPKNAKKASIYLLYKKAIFSGQDLARWQKFLVEIPIEKSWEKGNGDETVTLGSGFELHATREEGDPDWAGIRHNILGDSSADLAQTGDTDMDDQGRIYWRGGANGIVRFDPNTKKFEYPPCAFTFQKFVPGWKGSQKASNSAIGLLNDSLVRLACTRGRIYFMLCNDSSSDQFNTGDLLARRLGGLFSIPQDWSNAKSFASDIRMHVGSWPSAKPSFYKTDPEPNADVRKLGGLSLTETGFFITSAGGKYDAAGGPWRLDLDNRGHNKAFGEVTALTDSKAKNGTHFPPTQEIMVNGLPRRRVMNVGMGSGRHLVDFSSGELMIPRASIRQLLMSDGWNETMAIKSSKHAMPTYDGAPDGTVRVKFDIITKLKTSPAAEGALAESVSGGASLGPAFLITPIPGEANKAVAVCEYAIYPLSTLDFSKLAETKSVKKSPLPSSPALQVGLGPYNSLWLEQDGEQWLHISGYSGMTRINYSKDGRVSDPMISDLYHGRLDPRPVDGHPRDGLKDWDWLVPIFGGRLLNSGGGRLGRGGTAFTTGIELLDPKQFSSDRTARIPTETAAFLSRCCGGLDTVRSRMIWNARDGVNRQEIFGVGKYRQQYADELAAKNKDIVPKNLASKIFLYEVSEKDGLRDRFGFTLPPNGNGVSAGEGDLALSPCHRFLIVMTEAGLYTYSIAQKQFIDGIRLRTPGGDPIQPLAFKRPGELMLPAPDGQLFFLAARNSNGKSVQFNRIGVDKAGLLSIEPYWEINGSDKLDWKNIQGAVRCFMPDLVNHDGSYDLILGSEKATVHVIADFIPPVRPTAPGGKRSF